MQLGKIKDVFKDWVRSGFYFGRGLSNQISAGIQASPRGARIGGGIFDVAAGSGLTYLAASSFIGNTLAIVGAATTILSAPVSAVVTAAVAVVFLALSTITGGLGLGLLDAAREKAGFARPGTQAISRVRDVVARMGDTAKSALKFDKKASKDFRRVIEIDMDPAPKPEVPKKPAPKNAPTPKR